MCPFVGERFAIVAYTTASCNPAPEEVKLSLRKVGLKSVSGCSRRGRLPPEIPQRDYYEFSYGNLANAATELVALMLTLL